MVRKAGNTLPSQGSQIKFDRATEHLESLSRRVETFVADNPVTITVEPNPDPPHYIAIARGYVDPDPSLGALIGDFAHNARSSLDLVISHISKLAADDVARFKLQFPIFDQEVGRTSYRKSEHAYLKGVGTADRAVIEGFQPYRLGNNYADDLLGILAHVNDADKHRLVHVVGNVAWGGLRFYGPADLGAIHVAEGADVTLHNTTIRGWPSFGIEWINQGVVTEAGATVANITSQREMNVEPEVVPQIQFGEGSGRAQGRPLVETLTAILHRVDEVLGRF